MTMPTRPTMLTMMTSSDSWLIDSHGEACTYLALMVAKHPAIQPAVNNILRVGNASMQAAVLRAVVDHPSLASACELLGIKSSKQKAVANYLGQQSARMMERNRNTNKSHGNSTAKKRNAVEVMLTFTAPSPEKTAGVPGVHEHACIIGMPKSTCHCVKKNLLRSDVS
jgi:hypothetical protein